MCVAAEVMHCCVLLLCGGHAVVDVLWVRDEKHVRQLLADWWCLEKTGMWLAVHDVSVSGNRTAYLYTSIFTCTTEFSPVKFGGKLKQHGK